MKLYPRSALMRVLLALVVVGAIATASFLGGAYAYKHRARLRAMIGQVRDPGILQTTLYNLRLELVAVPAEGRDGGIAPLEDGILFVNREGRAWHVDADRELRELALRVPLERDAFLSDPDNEGVLYTEMFGVKDILLQDVPGGVRLFVSHSHWFPDRDCVVMRVSALETTRAALRAGDPGGASWRTVYDSEPCKELEVEDETRVRVALGVGGRMALLPDGDLLLTVGGYDPPTEMAERAPQDPESHYGKTIRIDPQSGAASVYTLGHRNPQGLAVGPDSSVWLTEHGPRGGDELNLLREDANYGYPMVSYGTWYGTLDWPVGLTPGRHDGYEEPIVAWAPSIAPSQLVVLGDRAFEKWRGDLMVSSLGARSLFRVHLADGRAVLVEPIPVDHRIRDLIQTDDGRLVLLTDDGFLIYVSPVSAAADDPSLSIEERGAILATNCQGCHSLEESDVGDIGPGLHGIVGRPVASIEGFRYSEALARIDGRWTAERLRSFLTDPQAFAPGTLMSLPEPLSADEVAALVAYLETLD